MLDDRTVSKAAVAQNYRLWSGRINRFAWASYLGGADPDVAVPARRTDLAGLPPAWIGVGTADLFYDEDVAHAERLNDAGVPCISRSSRARSTASTASARGRECHARTSRAIARRCGPRSRPDLLLGEFAWHHEHVDQRAVAKHGHLDPSGDRVLDHQLLDRGGGDDVVAVDADDDVASA